MAGGILDWMTPSPGLLGSMGGGAAPMSGPLFGLNGRLAQFRQQNPAAWNAMAAGLLAGPTLGQGLARAAAGFGQAQQADVLTREDMARKTALNNLLKSPRFKSLSPEERQYYVARPEAFDAYVQSMGAGPKPTDDIREYEFAKSQGYGGSFQDWMIEGRKAGASTINVGAGEVGTIPPGYELLTDPVTKARTMRPIPGGPPDAERLKVEAATKTKTDRAAVTNDIVLQDIDRSLETIKGGAVGPFNTTTGVVGALTSGFPGSPANKLEGTLNTIKANVGFDRLQAMRDSSPTGGALGQVSAQENILLQSVLGSLEASRGESEIIFNLKRLKNVYLDIIHGPGNGPPREDLGRGDGGAGVAPAVPAGPAPVYTSPSGVKVFSE